MYWKPRLFFEENWNLKVKTVLKRLVFVAIEMISVCIHICIWENNLRTLSNTRTNQTTFLFNISATAFLISSFSSKHELYFNIFQNMNKVLLFIYWINLCIQPPPLSKENVIACDVRNRFLGTDGGFIWIKGPKCSSSIVVE